MAPVPSRRDARHLSAPRSGVQVRSDESRAGGNVQRATRPRTGFYQQPGPLSKRTPVRLQGRSSGSPGDLLELHANRRSLDKSERPTRARYSIPRSPKEAPKPRWEGTDDIERLQGADRQDPFSRQMLSCKGRSHVFRLWTWPPIRASHERHH